MRSTAIEHKLRGGRSAKRCVVRLRTAASVEQEIQRAGVCREVPPEQPAWLEPDAPGPFEACILHPVRRALAAAGEEIEQSARGLDDADFGQPRGGIFGQKQLSR